MYSCIYKSFAKLHNLFYNTKKTSFLLRNFKIFYNSRQVCQVRQAFFKLSRTRGRAGTF